MLEVNPLSLGSRRVSLDLPLALTGTPNRRPLP